MARKFGKKNVIKVDPLAYNLGLIGESGIGKTTLAKEVCEKLVGEEGYLVISAGKEDGFDAIPGIIYEEAQSWDKFDEITRDIIENRNTDYKDLKVIVYDTLDELINIAEEGAIKEHNKENPQKRTKSINAAFGGFGKGEKRARDLILERIWELKRYGISMFIIGHTKPRTMTDVATGIEYDMLTTNMPHSHFNAFKTKLHVLGVASVDRSIKKETTTNKIGKIETVGKVTGESRIITFRDDNYNIDSKSRFDNIVPSIPLDADAFIKAIKDAIESAHEKQADPKPIEDVKIEQQQESEAKINEYIESKSSVDVARNEALIESIKNSITQIDNEKMQEIMAKYGIKDFMSPAEIETKALEEIAALV